MVSLSAWLDFWWQNQGVVGWERVGTEFPHLHHVLLSNELKAVLKWLFFGCVPTPFC